MFQAIISFLAGPIVNGFLKAYEAHLAATTTSEQTAAGVVGNELSVEAVDINAMAQVRIAAMGHWWYLIMPDTIMEYVVAFYYGKLLIWDKCFGLGSTDALAGFAATTSAMIITYLFGKRAISGITTAIQAVRRG